MSRCYSCKSFYHTLNYCPYLHYVANRFKVIRNSTNGKNDRSKDVHRINKCRFKYTLSCKSDIEQQALIY